MCHLALTLGCIRLQLVLIRHRLLLNHAPNPVRTFHKPKLNLLSLEIELRVCQLQSNLESSVRHSQQQIRHLRALVRGYRREDLYGSGLDLQELNQYQGLTHELNVIENLQHHIHGNQSNLDLNHKSKRYHCRHRC